MRLIATVVLALALTTSIASADRGSRHNRGDSWDFRSSGGWDRGQRYNNYWRNDSRWSFSVGLSTTGFEPRHHFTPSCRSTVVRWHGPRTVWVREPVVVIREPTVIVRDPVIVRESFCGPSAVVTERVVVREPVFIASRSVTRVGHRSAWCSDSRGWSFSGRVTFRN